MSSELQLDVRYLSRWWRHLVNADKVKTQAWQKLVAAYCLGDELKSYLRADCLYTGISSWPNAR